MSAVLDGRIVDRVAYRSSLADMSYSPYCPSLRTSCMRLVEEMLTALGWTAVRTWTDPQLGGCIAGSRPLGYGLVHVDYCSSVAVYRQELFCTPTTIHLIAPALHDSTRETLSLSQLSFQGPPNASSASFL